MVKQGDISFWHLILSPTHSEKKPIWCFQQDLINQNCSYLVFNNDSASLRTCKDKNLGHFPIVRNFTTKYFLFNFLPLRQPPSHKKKFKIFSLSLTVFSKSFCAQHFLQKRFSLIDFLQKMSGIGYQTFRVS